MPCLGLGKELTVQTRGPEFRPPAPMYKARCGVRACNLRAVDVEAGGYMEPSGQPALPQMQKVESDGGRHQPSVPFVDAHSCLGVILHILTNVELFIHDWDLLAGNVTWSLLDPFPLKRLLLHCALGPTQCLLYDLSSSFSRHSPNISQVFQEHLLFT